jgi:hypothetical protein|tara:strand:- start:1 stop:423 length:423 start_codon:yes stop_codon:yes gene_type:complete
MQSKQYKQTKDIMTNLLLSRDFDDFNNHELKVAAAAIKEQVEKRDKAFMSQFDTNLNIAIKWDNGNNYPAVITKVNKKSIDVLYIREAIKDERNILNRPVQAIRRFDIDQLKKLVETNRIQNVFWNKEFTNYPVTNSVAG